MNHRRSRSTVCIRNEVYVLVPGTVSKDCSCVVRGLFVSESPRFSQTHMFFFVCALTARTKRDGDTGKGTHSGRQHTHLPTVMEIQCGRGRDQFQGHFRASTKVRSSSDCRLPPSSALSRAHAPRALRCRLMFPLGGFTFVAGRTSLTPSCLPLVDGKVKPTSAIARRCATTPACIDTGALAVPCVLSHAAKHFW